MKMGGTSKKLGTSGICLRHEQQRQTKHTHTQN